VAVNPGARPAKPGSSPSFDELADRMVTWAVDEPRVRALWIEGDSQADLRRPYRALRLHLAVDEPQFPALVAELGSVFARVLGAKTLSVADTRRLAKELTLEAHGLDLTCVAEQSNLLAKRPRAFVAPLVDKTGHLTHVMDFSDRGKAAGGGARRGSAP
jgi:hypothetical protein